MFSIIWLCSQYCSCGLFTSEFSMTFRCSEASLRGVVLVLVSHSVDCSWMIQVCSEKEEDNSL